MLVMTAAAGASMKLVGSYRPPMPTCEPLVHECELTHHIDVRA